MRIATAGAARARLLDRQREDGCIPTLPSLGDTIETDAGWAFFNVNGYLGTVTEDGELIEEPELVDAE